MGAVLTTRFADLGIDVGLLLRELPQADWAVPLRRCEVYLRAKLQEGFERSQAPDGSSWLPLAHPRSRGGSKPLLDTGKLRSSLTVEATSTGADFVLRYGSNLEYASVHQWGATITPKRGKKLSIPLTPAAGRLDTPRAMPGLFPVRTTAGKLLLARRQGRGKKQQLVFHWVLVDQVTVPARPFLGVSTEAAEVMAGFFVEQGIQELERLAEQSGGEEL